MEGIPATNNTIYVDTTNTRVDIATATYSGGITKVGLHISSNVVVDDPTAVNSCIIFSTGTIACKSFVGDGSGLSGVIGVSSFTEANLDAFTYSNASSLTNCISGSTVSLNGSSFDISFAGSTCDSSTCARAANFQTGVLIDGSVISGQTSTIGVSSGLSNATNTSGANLAFIRSVSLASGNHNFCLAIAGSGGNSAPTCSAVLNQSATTCRFSVRSATGVIGPTGPPGGSTIAISTGSKTQIGSPAGTFISSPTAVLNFDSGMFTGSLQQGATAFISISTTSFVALFKIPTIQHFTSGSGTYTTPAGVIWIKITMIGGGGAGAGSGGAGVGTGTAGAATTFGSSLLTANGGAANNGAGGTASGGYRNLTGATGPPGQTAIGFGDAGFTGCSSPFGGAGAGAFSGTGGNAQANTGSGGAGGGGTPTVGAAAAGACGGYLEAIIGTPSATYSYGIGAGGTGGAAGTGGSAGGNGGSGDIAVEEHYN